MSGLGESIRTQIDELSLDSNRPLLLCDADEVLFQFVRGLERHLETQGFHLDLISFSLFGNIKHGLNKYFIHLQRPASDSVIIV